MNIELAPREFVIQPNAISQSIYSAGVYARRMLAMGMSLLPPETDEKGTYTVSFSLNAFMKSLGMEPGTKQLKLIEAAVKECAKNLIIVLDEKRKTKTLYTWFQKIALRDSRENPILIGAWDTVIMTFNPKLAEFLINFRKQYAKINLLDFGKLQGRYAIRLYEMALSYSGFAGKDGNPRGEWFFQETVEDIRLLFDIDSKKYKTTNELRRNIIDNPIEEINAADIGIRIEPDYIRHGKRLMEIRFNCRWIKKGEPLPVTPATDTGQEDDRLKDTYPEEFENLKAEGRKQRHSELFKGEPRMEELAAEVYALKKLRELHPEPPKKSTKKRSSAKKTADKI